MPAGADDHPAAAVWAAGGGAGATAGCGDGEFGRLSLITVSEVQFDDKTLLVLLSHGR